MGAHTRVDFTTLPETATAEQIEDAAAAMWNSTASIPWDQVPESWKPFYRKWAEAALRSFA